MFARRAPLALLMLLWAAAGYAADPPPLTRARTLYNAADYDGAIAAATAARRQPASADAAALVEARAHLERYRRTVRLSSPALSAGSNGAGPTGPDRGAEPGANPGASSSVVPGANAADLAAARDALAGIRMTALTPRDQVDLLVGLGQSLYLSEQFGAAAEMFETALGRGGLLTPRDRVLLLDWWASALDLEAQTRPPEHRAPVFQRLLVRMEEALREDPWSAPANYWLAVASRGAGDIDRAWDAAVAGWVRASLTREFSDSLRADLDRLVTQALIPERARVKPPREQADAALALSAEWDQVKQQWK